MVSSTVNVVRYTALFSGVFYGWYHLRTLKAEAAKSNIDSASHHQQKLIAEAKAAWKQKQERAAGASPSEVISDPEHPAFDLEKLLTSWDKTS
ncbi:hypothetical protein FA13DRAFT_246079 [Coprinellus micaceus]|uniref:ATP synthase F(0) complex subunit e, mitochondrial n=1 Tax=Coprinellus micaceus TaxID=71717 RepID=A0A4Y7TFJ0_COPMI|nr:hypothetical protein FA13DRAFT_246079 [Coprinellus micaceus]